METIELSSFLGQLLMATGLAGLIGLEREMRQQEQDKKEQGNLGGLRTFAMVGALGYLSQFTAMLLGAPWLLGLLLATVMLFALFSHGAHIFLYRHVGITSELSLIAGFVLGVFVGFGEPLLATAVSILFTTLLMLKGVLHRMVQRISHVELLAIIQFLILSAIILPLLPSSWVDPFGLFDWRPRTIWLMVVLVASIRFVGYFLAKIVGAEKSILLSGIVGGLASSTAVTTSISQDSKGNDRHALLFLIPILFASAIMFLRVLFEVSVTATSQQELLHFIIWPLLSMTLVSTIIATTLYLRRRKKKATVHASLQIRQPLKLGSALSFGLFFLLVLFLAEHISQLFPDTGLLLTGAISGLTDVDAITLAMANLVQKGDVAAELGASVILIAVIVNTLVKLGIILLFGSRRLFFLALLTILPILAVGGLTLFLM